MNLTKKPYIRENRIARALLFGTLGSLLLLAGACSFTTDMTEGSVNPKLSVMGLQSDVTEVNIRVTGQDYQRSTTVTPSDNRVEFFLPPGDDVKFEVEAANQDSATSHVYSWGMTRYADLVEGEETELDFTMGPKDTKIVVPDYVTSGGTIVQVSNLDVSEDVNSLTSDQWNTTELGLDYPYDTALDNQGRIWISYYGPYSEYYPIIMINDITSSAPDYDPEVSGSAIAFDRTNNYLYIGQPGEGSAIKFIHVTQDVSDIAVGTDTFELWQESEINSANLFGLAADDEGYLYFAGQDQSFQPTIFKYDPQRTAGNRVVATYNDQNVISSLFNMDLLVKNNHLYLTNIGGSSGNVIIKLTKELQYVDSFGRVVDFTSGETADQLGEFYGPTRFLATTAEHIYLTDDNAEYIDGFPVESPNRIIRFKDIEGSDWKAYRPVGSEGDELGLYAPIPS